ncbi:hypothetical protein L3X38_033226 [Prunus dulcis]|uniref:Uncharacterized protein n=1 Tax=Prunus dulcis TaxID=3755 RepID=A0AAD4VFS3_PRUDU|nr:hypothetical protein L3X38_033226 [Prunus dulcis]
MWSRSLSLVTGLRASRCSPGGLVLAVDDGVRGVAKGSELGGENRALDVVIYEDFGVTVGRMRAGGHVNGAFRGGVGWGGLNGGEPR